MRDPLLGIVRPGCVRQTNTAKSSETQHIGEASRQEWWFN